MSKTEDVCFNTKTLWEEKRSTRSGDPSLVQSGEWMRGVRVEYWPAQTRVCQR